MFHPLWEDVGGAVSPAKDDKKEHCKLCGPVCKDCGHSMKVHRLNGACYGASNCKCGWLTDMKGALYVKSTGEYAGDSRRGNTVRADILGHGSRRKRNKGAKVGVYKRADLLMIPCYFCGGKAESIDHFVARSKGGTSDRANLVSACHVCNGMKSDKTYDELLEFCRQMETAICRSTSLRRLATFLTWKDQAKKILEWHEKRMAAREA